MPNTTYRAAPQQHAILGMSAYGLGIGRFPTSHVLFEGVWSTAIQTCKGTMNLEELKQAVAAAQLAGLKWEEVDLGHGKADEVVVDMVRAARGAVDGHEG